MNEAPILVGMAMGAIIGYIVGWKLCDVYHEVKAKQKKGGEG